MEDDNNLELEKLQLIDISLEDDLLIDSSLDDCISPEDFRFSVTMEDGDWHIGVKKFVNSNFHEAKRAAEVFDKWEQKLSLSGCTESGRATNSRISLAWNSAFFTNAGVLDPDELFIMNKGFEEVEARKRKSTYSEFTFDTDGFFLESNQNTEAGLLEDVRASIQKHSLRTNIFSSVCKSGVREAHIQKTHISKELDAYSQTKEKSMPTARKQSLYKQGTEKFKKGSTHGHIGQHGGRNGELKLFSPKPPKILGRINLSSARSTQNVPFIADNVKMEHKSARSGKGLISSKKSCLGKSCSTSSMASLISSSSFSVTTSSDSVSSCSASDSAPSFKSSAMSTRKAVSRKDGPSVSASTSRTPVTCSLRVKNELKNPRLLSCDSTVGSTDSCSSESSLISNKGSNGFEANTDGISLKESCSINVATQVLDLQSHSNCQSFNQDHQQTYLPNQRPKAGKGNTSAESSIGFKASGLRMPSPKIGFFDEEKSSVDFQFHIGSRSASPRKNEGPSPATPRYTKWKQELDNKPLNLSSKSPTLRKYPVKTSKGQTSVSPSLSRENRLKSQRVGDGRQVAGKPRVQSSLSTERKRTKGVSEDEMNRDRCKIYPSKYDDPVHKNKPKIATHHQLVESNHGSLNEIEKENMPSFEDDVNSLSKYIEGIDLSNDMAIELNETTYSSTEYSLNCLRVLSNTSLKPMPTTRTPTSLKPMPNTRTPLADRNSISNRAQLHL